MISKKVFLAALLLAAVATGASAAPVATVSTVRGDVSVTAAATGKARKLATDAASGRVVNGTLGAGDEIRTAAGAAASILFPDGSVVRLDEATRLAADERALPGTPRPGRKTIKRTLVLRDGTIRVDAKPNTPIYTSIRTPHGVVGLRGTKLTVTVAGGRFQVSVESGKVFMMDSPGRAVFDIGNGQTVQLEVNERQQLVGQVLTDNGAPVRATIGNARVTMESGAIIRVSGVAGERLSVTALAGKVDLRYPATGKTESVPVGQTVPVLGPDAPPGLPPAGEEAAAAAGVSDRDVPDAPTMPIVRDTVEGSPYK